MKILIISDAAAPQVNGVVTTLANVGIALSNKGHQVEYLTHENFKTFALPTYKEIRLAWDVWNVGKRIKQIKPDAIHIATEGTLGIAARIYCARKGLEFTTSYHTKTPEYIKERLPIFPLSLGYAFMRWLHRPSAAVLVTTASVKQELIAKGFDPNKLVVWSRGADYEIFNPSRRDSELYDTVLLYAGRVAVEKNLEAFLELNYQTAIKVVVGDGPDRKRLEAKYPDVMFVGYKKGVDLATWMAQADVFVFPSRSDTFGIVMIEAAACGTPIAAYPVTGPKDFVKQGVNGVLDEDLSVAISKALTLDRTECSSYTMKHYSWDTCADILLGTWNQ